MEDSRLNQLYEAALEAGRRRDYPKAVRVLQEILVHTDAFPEALLLLGRSYHALHDYARAAQVFQLYLNTNPGSPQGHFFLGRSCYALDLQDLAVRHLRRSVELEPSFAPALGLLGLAVLRSGKPRLAIGFFEQALKIDPQNPRLLNGWLNALLTQAIRLFSRRRYQESEQLLLTLERHRPESLVVQLYLAGICRDSGRLELALAHLDRASRLAPEDPALYLQKAAIRLQRGETQAALLELSEGFHRLGSSAPPVSDPIELARLAMMILFQNRRHRAALEYARKLLRVSYQDVQAHAVMAECFASLREPRKAANHYRRAIELDPQSLELCYGLAAVLWDSGEYPALAKLADRIEQKNASDRYAAYYRALCCPHLGQSPEATIPILQEQIRVNGPDPQLMSSLGREYLRGELPLLARGWLERTLKSIEDHEPSLLALIEAERMLADGKRMLAACAKYLRHYPRNPRVRREYAELLYRSRDFQRAAAEIEQLLPREPRSAALRRMLARSYQKSRRPAEAVLLFRDLLRENPANEELLRELALSLAASGSQPTAVALVRKASQAYPNRPGLHVLLGALYLRARDLPRAAETFRRGLAAFPSDWRLNHSLGLVYRRQGNTGFAERFLKRARELRRAGKGRA